MSQEFLRHYEAGVEAGRLQRGPGLLELARTQELIERFMAPAPGVMVDVGGGPGVYACWLARRGYTVHLLDPVPLHLEQARAASALQPGTPLGQVVAGDARELPFSSESADGVLLLGPLYHLTERVDRMLALSEARRVLRPGGFLLAAGISRFASTLDGLWRHLLDDPSFAPIAERDLQDGQHRNPQDHPDYFTTAFFHHPKELQEELAEADFEAPQVLAVEGPGWLLPSLADDWQDPRRRENILTSLRRMESDPSLLGVSAHLLAVGQKPR